MNWLNEVTSAITGTLTAIGNAIFNFLKTGFTTLFFDTNAEGVQQVSDFAKFGFVIMGISLGLGLTYWIVNFVRKRR